tara:strand:+ start:186 stop:332 length:147 start_codon:yes stop_codon:yes gene_type:complete
MKNLIAAFSFFNFKKDLNKNLHKNDSFNKVNFVHRRRDLDALGEFIKF